MNKPTIAIDFDGVIYKRTSKDTGAQTFEGDAVPGAMNFLRHLSSAFEVVIFSSRFVGFDGNVAAHGCDTWLRKQFAEDVKAQVQRRKPPYDPELILSKLKYTATKPVARVYLDDRAITFTGTFPSIPELLSFKTWDGR